MRKVATIIILFLIILNYQQIHSQKSISKKSTHSLVSERYENLFQIFEDSKNDIETAERYAKAFLLKAKKENDTIKKAEGYYLLARILCRIPDYDKASIYLDSSITVSKDKNDFVYPAKSHILKANINGSQSKYQQVMDELGKANGYTNITNNEDQKYEIKYLFSLLQKNLGAYEKSIEILKEVIVYYEKKYLVDKNYEDDYILSLYAYSSALNYLKRADAADVINKKNTRLSLRSKDSILYDRILLASAITHYLKKEYKSSLDSIQKSKKIAKSKTKRIGTVVTTNYYLGNIYLEQGNNELAIKHLKKVDSLAFSEKYFPPGLRKSYELLIKFYKDKNDASKQLFYIDRLLIADSIMDNDVKYLSREMNAEYTTPNLILEKQRIIDSLEKSKNRTISVFVILSICLLLLFIWNRKKQKLYKKRFQELLEKTSSPENKEILIENDQPKNNTIPEDVVQDILLKLEKFEAKKGYLKKNLTVVKLAKQLDTNSKYFSKVINTYKNKSFTNYINELRIYYAIEELKINPKFRKYTIKAIANDIGFNTTEAFSKSFYKITNIFPSFFIKELEKRDL
ncbi:helix-turn-helix domain-containing protein [Aquimarina sp. AD10]|uniref:helix-turn-helix domain-containing protein n=1 Tax=Aquimarina sp. AD10 TaxID=1714849 RepID=UPI000E557EE6|nr:helix-turn-helix domain-containing protein [Aquimarina sp. AD10]AXT59558.1 helix-turn-helix domain-containing protein [Aquimarina sp. AD10]RKM93457.1 helix-turn-helix domain-containing protein [Aquimarina sp. AD10]